MPRRPRDRSNSGIYHVIIRGINKQSIFEDSEDKEKFLRTLKHNKTVSNFELYGYSVMDNHFHALIKENMESISLSIQRISSSYVNWYNKRHERCGHLFQERFRSQPVERDLSLLTVLRYIHQNPVKAGIVRNVSDYPWSSYHEYISKATIVDTDSVLSILSPDKQKAVQMFIEYTNELNDDECLDYFPQQKTDSEVRAILLQHQVSDVNQFLQLNKQKRYEIIRFLKSVEGVTVRQLSRVTGVSKSVISRL